MIVSTKGKFDEAVIAGKAPKGFPTDILRSAERRLRAVDAAVALDDLRSPPGNHLEARSGDRAGHPSIRTDDQWRLCFRWTEAGPADVEMTDFHQNKEGRPGCELRSSPASRGIPPGRGPRSARHGGGDVLSPCRVTIRPRFRSTPPRGGRHP